MSDDVVTNPFSRESEKARMEEPDGGRWSDVETNFGDGAVF